MKRHSAELLFVADVHKNILPEIDRAFHELISRRIEKGSLGNIQAEVQNCAEWLKPVINEYIDDQLRHCFVEPKDQTET